MIEVQDAGIGEENTRDPSSKDGLEKKPMQTC